MLRNRLFLEWLSLCIGACLLAVWSIHSGLTDRIDTRLLDSSTVLARAAPSQDIVIVAIDDTSLAALGSWPWSRDVHAQLVDGLRDQGVRQIIYDVLFLEPTDEVADNRFAASIEQAGNVIMPHTFGSVSDAGDIGPVYPLAQLFSGAQATGHVAAEPDSDGVLRRFALEIDDGQGRYPHLTIAAVAAANEGADNDHQEVIERTSPWPIVPFNPSGSFVTTSASDVVNGTVVSGLLNGKTVYVGATAQGMGDRHPVATGQVVPMPGVETQVNLMNTLKGDSFIVELGTLWLTIVTCLVILLQFITFWKLPPQSNLLASALLLGGIVLASIAAVPLGQIWIAPGTAVIVLILAYPLWSWRRLTAVSGFLEVEAQKLSESTDPVAKNGGFDVIARQVGRMKNLVHNVNSSFVFLRQIIEAAPDPILVLNHDGTVDMWNEKAALLFPDTDLSESPGFPELFMSRDISVDHDAGEVTTTDGRTFLMAKGAFDEVLAEGESETGSGESEGEVIVLRDISQIRRQEDERREMLEFLSHDMRTPQVAIVGLTQKAAGSINNNQRLERIQVQAQRTLKLADDFVQLARLEEAELLFEDTDLISLVQESCDRAFVASRRSGVALDQPDQEDPVYAQVEASLVARLLDNLIGNAIKFSPSGSKVVIRVHDSQDGNVMLEVSDDGPGFPPERKADPFARFGAHDTKAGPSVGLGLTFVQRAVLKHKGQIDVESDPETGTSFRITLPEVQA